MSVFSHVNEAIGGEDQDKPREKKSLKNVFSNYKRVSHLGKQGLLSTPSPTSAAAEDAGGPMGNEMARLGPVPSAGRWHLQA